MLQGEQYPYEIVKVNHNTGQSQIIEVVRGESAASSFAESCKRGLSQQDRDAGWGYYINRTISKPTVSIRRSRNLKPGSGRKR